MSKQWTNATSQKERGHYFPQGDTDGAYRYGVIGRLSAKFGYQDETVRSDSRPETHLGSQRAWNKEKLGQKLDLLKRSPFLPRGVLKNFYFKSDSFIC